MASILVTHGGHYVRGPDGHVHARDRVTTYAFWRRYLAVFDRVGVVARVGRAEVAPADLPRSDGSGVEFLDLPDYIGPWRHFLHRARVIAVLRAAIPQYDACCLRVPGPIGSLAWRELRNRALPFGVEVMADPWDSLGPGAIRSIARPFARRQAARDLRTQCTEASVSAYVTRVTLQRRYPPASGTFTTHYSSIELPPDAVVEAPRNVSAPGCRLVFVGTLAVLYKAPDVLIEAVARCRRPALRLTVIGDGRCRPRLEALAARLRVADPVRFLGALPAGPPVRQALDAADVFVLPSRQEGLPRAMIEAMARGLPCIGSTAGGIPELLSPDDMVPPDDPDALAAKILEVCDDPQRMQAAGAANLERSKDYLSDRLAERRLAFYEELCRVSRAAR